MMIKIFDFAKIGLNIQFQIIIFAVIFSTSSDVLIHIKKTIFVAN